MPNEKQLSNRADLLAVKANTCCRISILISAFFLPPALAQERNDPNEFFKLRTGPSLFRYYELGRHAPSRSGRKRFPLARFVVAPNIGLPIKVDPRNGIHMYCNTQVFGLGGFLRPKGVGVPSASVDSRANYQFPWTSNFCEKRGRQGSARQLRVCGTRYVEHLGQDCRPGRPINRGFEGLAVADGRVSQFGFGHLVSISNATHLWTYLHMDRRAVRRNQLVKKGQKLGLISNRPGNTSIHLHLEVQVKGPNGLRHMDPLPSLIVAYRRALGHDTTNLIDADGNLRLDPEYEIKSGSEAGGVVTGPCASTVDLPSISTEWEARFTSLWCHNGSVVGLVKEGESRKLVYVKPQPAIADAASRNPVLVEASQSGTAWRGHAIHYSLACEDRRFAINGQLSETSGSLVLTGLRDSFQNSDCDTVKIAESLTFQRLDNVVMPPPLPVRKSDDAVDATASIATSSPETLRCPHALKPGEKPTLRGGFEVPSKSERTCNFNALTLPRGKSLAAMPRYIREWPGLNPRGFLDDKNGNQIIAFSSEQSGVGAWWYWVSRRARHGAGLSKKGFGETGRLTLNQLALAMSGRTTMNSFVRNVYLKPYLKFAKRYFGRSIGENQFVDLRKADERWSLARTQFHLESGRNALIGRRSFDCGIRFGNDVMADFDAAEIGQGAGQTIQHVRFKGLKYYAHDCLGVRNVPGVAAQENRNSTTSPTDIAAAEAMITAQQERIQQLTADVAKLRAKLAVGDQVIKSVTDELAKLVNELQK
ncbi:MAG: M23 family metallopeptidase [Pseudomonadota bacterium]